VGIGDAFCDLLLGGKHFASSAQHKAALINRWNRRKREGFGRTNPPDTEAAEQKMDFAVRGQTAPDWQSLNHLQRRA
jgi:hypothetical protein